MCVSRGNYGGASGNNTSNFQKKANVATLEAQKNVAYNMFGGGAQPCAPPNPPGGARNLKTAGTALRD